MKRDLLEELIKTIEVNAIDNQATITDVKLWANSWRKEVEMEALTPTAVVQVCEHPYESVMSKCNAELNTCLKCGENL